GGEGLDGDRDLVLTLDAVQVRLGAPDGLGAEQPGLVADRRGVRRAGQHQGGQGQGEGSEPTWCPHGRYDLVYQGSGAGPEGPRPPRAGRSRTAHGTGPGRSVPSIIFELPRNLFVRISQRTWRAARGCNRARSGRLGSGRGDVGEPGDGDDLAAADQDPRAVAADAQAGRVVDVDLSGR